MRACMCILCISSSSSARLVPKEISELETHILCMYVCVCVYIYNATTDHDNSNIMIITIIIIFMFIIIIIRNLSRDVIVAFSRQAIVFE